jgi:hypothetical protein
VFSCLRRSVTALGVACAVFALVPVLGAGAAAGAHGYDISYPQCNGTDISPLPGHDSFDILGVNDGRVYSANPCLAAEYTWATGGTAALVSFYANTGNPGPTSSHWPKGETANGVTCPSQRNYRVGTTSYNNCSYVYGWDAAADSFSSAETALETDRMTVAPSAQWWLDIESANSWTRSTTANVDDIQGALDYLTQQTTSSGSSVGIYTNSSSWSSITGSTKVFASHPYWYPGATATTAPSLCTATSVTGGHIRYVQYVANNLDNDFDCG